VGSKKKPISIDPAHMERSGGKLGEFGDKLDTAGSRLAQAGDRLAQHASQDKSGIGAVLVKAMGRGTEVTGKVVGEGGRVVRTAGQHLTGTARTTREADAHNAAMFNKIHNKGNEPHPPGGGKTAPASGHSIPQGGRVPITTSGEHWMSTAEHNFDKKDFADFRQAMDKLAAEPKPGQVPGSAQLTQRERDLVARAMSLATIDRDTRMQKVIPPHAVYGYLGDLESNGNYRGGKWDQQIGGFVARHQDAGLHMRPEDVVRGNRLDYPNTAYEKRPSHIHTIEYPAGDPSNYARPVGASTVPGHVFDNDPRVAAAADEMAAAYHRAGVPPSEIVRVNSAWPYSGAGVTSDATMGNPEFKVQKPIDMPHGATINEYDAGGRKTVIARFDKVRGGWHRP
jgi:hypothetical protein